MTKFLKGGCLVLIGAGMASIVELTLLAPGCLHMNRPALERTDEPIRPRDEFTQLLLGKTEEEVLDTAGKPYRTSEDSEFGYWHYRNCTRDPMTEKVDTDVQVIFHNGKVVQVNY
jgi:hypothetical protein